MTRSFDHPEHEVQYQAGAGPVENFARDEARDQPQNDPTDKADAETSLPEPAAPTRLNAAQSAYTAATPLPSTGLRDCLAPAG